VFSFFQDKAQQKYKKGQINHGHSAKNTKNLKLEEERQNIMTLEKAPGHEGEHRKYGH
jgi:hypothetical protein